MQAINLKRKERRQGVIPSLVARRQKEEHRQFLAERKRQARVEKTKAKVSRKARIKKSRQYGVYKGIVGAISPKFPAKPKKPKRIKQNKVLSRKMRIKAF